MNQFENHDGWKTLSLSCVHWHTDTHVSFIFERVRCVCYTAHLYCYKLLNCWMPFCLNKHVWIGQTHSQRDALTFTQHEKIDNISIHVYRIVIATIHTETENKVVLNSVDIGINCGRREKSSTTENEYEINNQNRWISFSFVHQVSIDVCAFQCHHHPRDDVGKKREPDWVNIAAEHKSLIHGACVRACVSFKLI